MMIYRMLSIENNKTKNKSAGFISTPSLQYFPIRQISSSPFANKTASKLSTPNLSVSVTVLHPFSCPIVSIRFLEPLHTAATSFNCSQAIFN